MGHRYSASGLGVRWVVAIDSTRVRVPARALLLLLFKETYHKDNANYINNVPLAILLFKSVEVVGKFS